MRGAAWLALALCAIIAAVLLLRPDDAARQAPGAAGPPLGELLGEEAGFARALAPRRFRFPRDHGPHPDYKQEWWYYTGNLATRDGRRFGFQLTFFRFALAPGERPGVSAWGTRQVYLAHLALTDVANRRFHHVERTSRGALGLAGARPVDAQGGDFAVWLEDWSARLVERPLPGQCRGLSAAEGCAAMHLSAGTETLGLDLTLRSRKPLVLQGEAGLSRKGPKPGNASYYYSFTRLEAQGRVRLGEAWLEVSGTAWMDREWSTATLERGQVGWDWFALQLSDGSDLMLARLRGEDEAADFSFAILVDATGTARPLEVGRDVVLQATAHWRSPHTGARYPAAWRLELPARALALSVQPLLADQELHATAVRYWEGAVRVNGRKADRPVTGVGYVELTGYD